MDAATFEAELASEGFAVRMVTLPPNQEREMHTHPFDVRLLVLDGVFTLATEAGRQSFPVGGICMLAANTLHSEITGPQGARYLLGTRAVAAA